jgi:hypothetical protein
LRESTSGVLVESDSKADEKKPVEASNTELSKKAGSKHRPCDQNIRNEGVEGNMLRMGRSGFIRMTFDKKTGTAH